MPHYNTSEAAADGEGQSQKRLCASDAAISAACDPKFAREFAQALVGGASGAM